MLEVGEDARSHLAGMRVRWAPLERTGEPAGDLPDPITVVPKRSPDALSDHVVAQAYRKLFWELDIDPTKQRPAGEALARRIARGDELPRIHPLVDAYNLVSAATLVPISAFDLQRVDGPVRLDVTDGGERFDPIGSEPTKLPPGRPVLRDEEGLISMLAHRDAQRTALSEATDRALVLACGPTEAGPRVLPEAFRMLEQYASIVGWRFEETPQTIEV